jgi:cytochrome P450
MTRVQDELKVAGEFAGCPVTTWDNAESLPVGGHIDKLRQLQAMAPFVRNTHAQGFWMITEPAAIREALQTHEIYTTTSVVAADPNPSYLWLPLMANGAEHIKWRKLLQPAFSPRAIAAMEDNVERRCIETIESFADKGEVDFVNAFAKVYPTTIFMEVMGMPMSGLEDFLTWQEAMFHHDYANDPDFAKMGAAMARITDYFDKLIVQRRDDPQDDLLSEAVKWTMDGEPIPHEQLLSFCLLMFMAGLDTVTNQLTSMFWHLATHTQDRQRLLDEPDLIPTAAEEFLRFYSFVPTSRQVSQDVEFRGCPMKARDMAWLPIPIAARDPELFADPDTFKIDRTPNQHPAFGLGPHRCLGAHLARHELVVALREWHKRIPDYRLPDGADVMETGAMFGIRNLSLEWDTTVS